MRNYRIYLIKSDNTDKFYINGTTLSLYQRMANHKSDYRKHINKIKNFDKSRDIYEILKHDDAKIYLLENYSCTYRDELVKRVEEVKELYRNNQIDIQIKPIARSKTKEYHQEYQKRYRDRKKKELEEYYEAQYQMSQKEFYDRQMEEYEEIFSEEFQKLYNPKD